MKRRLLLSFAALVLSAGLSQAAFADTFSLTLSTPNQTAQPGGILSYAGTIAYTSSTSGNVINLDGIEFTTSSFSFVNPGQTCVGAMPCIDASSFFNNAPLTLSAGSSYTGVLFSVIVPPSSAISAFPGFVDITGDVGGTPVTTNIVGFSTTVTPEPSSWLLMATGLLGLAIAYRFRPQTAPSMTRI